MCDILLVVVLGKNIALDQRFAVMWKYYAFAFSFLKGYCSMWYLLNSFSNATAMAIMVSRISSVDTATVITVISVDTVTAISIVVMNTASVTEDIM